MKLKFDREALEQAKRELSITWPIRIKPVPPSQFRPTRLGVHNASDEQGRHFIRLVFDSTFTLNRMNETLWHELTHCAQKERIPDFDREYNKYRYDINPYELEANNVAREKSHIKLIQEIVV